MRCIYFSTIRKSIRKESQAKEDEMIPDVPQLIVAAVLRWLVDITTASNMPSAISVPVTSIISAFPAMRSN